MKFSDALFPSAILLCAGCATQTSQVSMANPSATFCAEQGGTYAVETAESPATCTLPDGSVVDAWEYFRANAVKT